MSVHVSKCRKGCVCNKEGGRASVCVCISRPSALRAQHNSTVSGLEHSKLSTAEQLAETPQKTCDGMETAQAQRALSQLCLKLNTAPVTSKPFASRVTLHSSPRRSTQQAQHADAGWRERYSVCKATGLSRKGRGLRGTDVCLRQRPGVLPSLGHLQNP